ncbi:MAG: hypothetical protein EBW68_06825, partial [Actinobacteria bacterium]|nr:hypothetical protein [Actinomycetota bacterium]
DRNSTAIIRQGDFSSTSGTASPGVAGYTCPTGKKALVTWIAGSFVLVTAVTTRSPNTYIYVNLQLSASSTVAIFKMYFGTGLALATTKEFILAQNLYLKAGDYLDMGVANADTGGTYAGTLSMAIIEFDA